MKKTKRWTKSEIAKFPPHIQKAMTMSYPVEPFIKAGVISPGKPVKATRHKSRGRGAGH